MKFLNLLEKVTNGSVIEISYTGKMSSWLAKASCQKYRLKSDYCYVGTSILYRPGAIEGGRIQHDCGTDRSISYYLEPMVALAPFSKKPFLLILEGITTDHIDPSVSSIIYEKRKACGLVITLIFFRWILFVQFCYLN